MSGALDLLLYFVYDKPNARPKVKTIQKKEAPASVLTLVSSWVSDQNIPTDDPDTTLTVTEISRTNFTYYLFDYEGDDPDTFRALCLTDLTAIVDSSVMTAG